MKKCTDIIYVHAIVFFLELSDFLWCNIWSGAFRFPVEVGKHLFFRLRRAVKTPHFPLWAPKFPVKTPNFRAPDFLWAPKFPVRNVTSVPLKKNYRSTDISWIPSPGTPCHWPGNGRDSVYHLFVSILHQTGRGEIQEWGWLAARICGE